MNANDQLRIDTMVAWLELFVDPDQVTELRAIWGHRQARSSFFTGQQLERLVQQAVQLEQSSSPPMGIYFTPNPLRADLLGGQRSARDSDVLARRWILIDIDPVRLASTGKPLQGEAARVGSTESERQAAWNVLCRCQETLKVQGFTGAIVADSGNGWHLCYRIDMPNDEDSKQLHRALLRGLRDRCADEAACVDTSTFNASRIWKLYGTRARKGEPTPDRPHRWARIIQDNTEESP